MKKIIALMLMAFAGALIAADTPLTLTKRDVASWGSPKYYQTLPALTVENSTAKILCGKTVPGAKMSTYQFGILNRKPLKAGTTYTLTFTVKSNMDIKGGMANFQLSGKPYTVFARTRVNLKANEPQTLKMVVTPTADVTAITRIPGLHIGLKEGQTLELSNITLTPAK